MQCPRPATRRGRSRRRLEEEEGVKSPFDGLSGCAGGPDGIRVRSTSGLELLTFARGRALPACESSPGGCVDSPACPLPGGFGHGRPIRGNLSSVVCKHPPAPPAGFHPLTPRRHAPPLRPPTHYNPPPFTLCQSRPNRAKYLRSRSASFTCFLCRRDTANSRRPASESEPASRQTWMT